MCNLFIKRLFKSCAVLLLTINAASASPLQGEKEIVLRDKQGQTIVVAHIQFQAVADEITYSLTMTHDVFKDYFLSMKEMKCLEGPELWCHLAYPYPQPRTVSEDDLSWLSHDLLFMFKKPNEFGANFWNGIYYDLSIEDGAIVGQAQAVDLNLLASPPQTPSQPPITAAERDEIDRTQRWLPDLIIR